jgi:putative phosphoribosyl transferase
MIQTDATRSHPMNPSCEADACASLEPGRTQGLRRFRDRAHAGAMLARALAPYRGPVPLVLGVARGGAEVAGQLAERLGADLDLIVAQKLRAPSSDVVIGAITAERDGYLDDSMVQARGLSDEYVQRHAREKIHEAQAWQAHLRERWPKVSLEGRVVIVVDDGIESAATMRAVVRSVRMQRPRRLIVAVPQAPLAASAIFVRSVDELVWLSFPAEGSSLRDRFDSFPEVSYDDVDRVLRSHAMVRQFA